MEFFCTLALFSSRTPVIDFAPPWPKDKSNLIIPATLHNSKWSIDRNCSLFLWFRFFYLRRVVEKYFLRSHTSSAHIFLAGLPSADCRRTAQQQKKAEENFSPPKTSLTHTSAPTAHTRTNKLPLLRPSRCHRLRLESKDVKRSNGMKWVSLMYHKPIT